MVKVGIFLVFILVGVSAKKTVIEKSEGIYIMTEKNYDKAVEEFEYLLVYFYAPWCGHCKALGPEFVKAGQLLKEKGSSIKLGNVNGEEEPGLMDREGVTGYPTLKLYRKGDLVPYTGGRMAPEMVSWLEKKIGPSALPLLSIDEVEAFISKHEVAVVGFFSEGSEEKDKYNSVCKDYDDYGVHYPVALVTDIETAAHYKAKQKLVLFKKFDEKEMMYSGELEVENVRDFITENSLRYLTEMNHENAQKLFKRPNNGKAHLLVFHNRSSEVFEEEKKMLARVGKEFRQKVLFTSVDVGEEDHRRMVEFLGVRHRINNDTFPSMRIVTMYDTGPPIRFKPEDTQVTEANVRGFVTKYISGEVKREYYTEPLPSDWDAKQCKYITGVNFKTAVTEDKSKVKLVMWYAPWCGHCKVMMSVMEELGVAFSDITVAKIDATVNEIPGLPPVHSFPTIKLYRMDGSESEYNGERTVAGLSKFITTDGEFGRAAPDDPPKPHDEL